MNRSFALPALAAVALASLTIMPSAIGAEATVGASTFSVSVMDPATRQWHRSQGSVVPLRPQQACFDWRLYIVTASADITVKETFNAPASPTHWPDRPDIKVRNGGRVAEVSLTFPLRVGGIRAWIDEWTGQHTGQWIGHGWCIEAGDPEGAYFIDVSESDRLLHRFCFAVIADDTERATEPRSTPLECGDPTS
jgi:hypothetical protein